MRLARGDHCGEVLFLLSAALVTESPVEPLQHMNERSSLYVPAHGPVGVNDPLGPETVEVEVHRPLVRRDSVGFGKHQYSLGRIEQGNPLIILRLKSLHRFVE